MLLEAGTVSVWKHFRGDHYTTASTCAEFVWRFLNELVGTKSRWISGLVGECEWEHGNAGNAVECCVYGPADLEGGEVHDVQSWEQRCTTGSIRGMIS